MFTLRLATREHGALAGTEVLIQAGKIEAVRDVLATHLDAHPGNPERFGNGTFIYAMDYGDRGDKGDMVWYVSRKDDLLRRRTRLRSCARVTPRS